ncbi:hypothetical protein [Comamonas thiooxydans]|uniref:hypothetical protein n=1 Tax=Comamonas thiooxydans TaxID=363952 RepID=UPI002113CFAC|nr:hypothetical protein [Comamonas thiooxydans]UUE94304.1 hypothetical protein MJ608_01080 [Comamonas thiooxydans]
MNFSAKELKSLSDHLSSYNPALYLQAGDEDIIKSTVKSQLNKGNNSFLTSISLSDLRVLLLMRFENINDQIIQATPKTKLKSFVLSLKNIDFSTIIYSLVDANNRKFLISFLSGVKANRWNFIFRSDASINEEYNKDLIKIKKNLESLQKIKIDLSKELNDLKDKGEEIRKRNNEMESIYSDHESTVKAWEDRIADAENLFKRSEAKRQAVNKKINEREEALLIREKEISEENQKLLKQKVEQSLPGYVRKTQALLKAKERAFSRTGKNWSYIGIASVIIAIYCGVFFTIYSFDFLNSNQNLEWKYLLINVFKGGLVVGIFLYVAQHAFNVSNAYIHESIQRSDKRHAINFGELFLKIYGSSLQREELLKVFENWNISTDSAFKKIQSASIPKEFAGLLGNFKIDTGGKSKKPDAD